MISKKVPFVQQTTETDCGAACLTMLLHYYGNKKPLHQVSKMCMSSRNGITIKDIINTGKLLGLSCRAYKIDKSRFFKDIIIKNPIIILSNNNHFFVLEKIESQKIIIVDPEKGRKKICKLEFLDSFSGVFITVDKTAQFEKKRKYEESIIEILRSNFTKYRIFFYCLLITVAIQICSLLIPFMTQYVIDDLTNIKVYMIFSFGLIIIFLYGILNYVKNVYVINISYDFWELFTRKIVDNLFNCKLRFFDTRASGDLLNRVNNINTIKDLVARIGNSFIIDSISVIVFGSAMMIISKKLFCVVLFIAILQAMFFLFSIKKIQLLIKVNMEDQEVSSTYLLEIIKNMIIIKTSEFKNDIYSKWIKLFQNQKKTAIKKEKYYSLFQCILMSIKLLPTICLLSFGIQDVLKGEITLGELIAFTSLSAYFINPIASIINSIHDLEFVKTVIGRLMEIYYSDLENTRGDKFIQNINSISAENIIFEYSNAEKEILKNVSFNIRKGDKIAFVGRTGSGKSTLIKLILGLYTISEGKIFINDINLDDIDLEEYRKKIGIVLQDTYFFNTTIKNNIDISGKYEIERVKIASQIAGISDEIEKMPMNYNTIIGENGKNLSGGQRQRIAIARALIKKPDVIIFDEGTNQLDAITEKNIYRKLKEAKITQIIVSHRLSSIKDSDHIYYIENGEIAEHGMHEDLLINSKLYSSVWWEQN